jgi:hypothetical protein
LAASTALAGAGAGLVASAALAGAVAFIASVLPAALTDSDLTGDPVSSFFFGMNHSPELFDEFKSATNSLISAVLC